MGLRFNAKQRYAWNILSSPQKTRILFDGGSRSGKTALIVEYLVRRALQYPGSRQLAARKCRAHAKSSLWEDTIKGYLARHFPEGFCKRNESELALIFPNRSRIIVGGLDDAERTEKILGNEYITVFLNEATQLSFKSMQMAVTRLSQKSFDAKGRKAVPKLIMDCNPRGPRHWLHLAGVRHIDPESGKSLPDEEKWARVSWSAYDNRENLPPEYLASLEALPDLMRDRMLSGIWRDNEGAVYDEFDEECHVVSPFPVPDDWKRVRSIDFGFTNAFVCLWGAVDHDGRLYIYRELYKNRTRTRVLAQEIRRLSGSEKYLFSVADHDAQERAELEVEGIPTNAADKRVTAGIQAVKNLLAKTEEGSPRLFFFSGLKNLLSEIYEYKWLPSDDSRNAKEEPLKFNDHAMDALRYMVMALEKKSAPGTFRSQEVAVLDKGRWE
ncbi:MAG: phage terminase large subunit [Lentisphaeria bacterium]|nr:phage terminase large subunit [Lentisphaeria bacterium]